MSPPIAFYAPRTLNEAVGYLERHGDEAKVVSGATALAILLRQRLIQPEALVSLGSLQDEGLRTITREGDVLRIGSLVTHREVEQSPLVRQLIPALAETFGKVGNIRVRTVATVGGVLAEADYASDPPSAFLALDASIEVVGPRGSRSIPVSTFFRGFYETSLEPTELIVAVKVPLPEPGTVAVYEKFVTRSSEDRPCVGVFAAVRLTDDRQRCAELRVAVGAAAEVPQRFPDLEALAHGKPLARELAVEVAEGYAARIDTLDDLRGSAWYRTEMVKVWVRRAIEAAQRGASGAPRA